MNIPTQITDNLDLAAKVVVDTNERILDSVVSFNRSVVDGYVRTADRIPTVDLPYADKLPTPAEAGERYIGFVDQVVSANRELTAQVVGLLPTGVAPVAKTKATKAAK